VAGFQLLAAAALVALAVAGRHLRRAALVAAPVAERVTRLPSVGSTGVQLDEAHRKLELLASLAERQLDAQLSQADSNTAIAVGLLALSGALAGAILTVGLTSDRVGPNWAWPLIGYLVASFLLATVLVRKTYKLGPRPAAHYLDSQDETLFDFGLRLVTILEADFASNERLLELEQYALIYPALAVVVVTTVIEGFVLRR